MKNATKSFLRLGLVACCLMLIIPGFAQDKKDNYFKVGGAVRFNIYDKSWVDSKKEPEFTWDTWRLNVDGSQSGLDFSFEYRFYPTFGTHFIHHGYIGYAFNKDLYMKLGVTQVPFGIQKYASHSWWFQGQYYFGLEDDYDIGASFKYTGIDKLDLTFAYFRQAEPEGPVEGSVSYGNAGPGRYSYDITPGTGRIDTTEVSASIRELNQFNVRAAYHLTQNVELGFSLQVGGIYNSVLNKSTWSNAYAFHVLADWGKGWNFKGTALSYNYKAKSDDGQILDIVQMGAYGTPYDVAAKAKALAVGIAKTYPVKLGPISSIQAYVDYTYVHKQKSDYYDMQQLVPGFLITAGPIYTYVDYAMGKNHPWLNTTFGDGMGVGAENDKWQKRLNINIGYYF